MIHYDLRGVPDALLEPCDSHLSSEFELDSDRLFVAGPNTPGKIEQRLFIEVFGDGETFGGLADVLDAFHFECHYIVVKIAVPDDVDGVAPQRWLDEIWAEGVCQRVSGPQCSIV